MTEGSTFGPSALLTPANVITIVRLVLAPVAFWMILQDRSSWPLFVLWFSITASDSLDGYLARRQGTTRSGAFLDPLADKVLALGGLWAMVLEGRFWWVPVVLITLREVVISAFRSYWGRRGLAVQASQRGQVQDLPAVRGGDPGDVAVDDGPHLAGRRVPVGWGGRGLDQRGAVPGRRFPRHHHDVPGLSRPGPDGGITAVGAGPSH